MTGSGYLHASSNSSASQLSRNTFLLAALILLSYTAALRAESPFQVTTVVEGQEHPWGMAFYNGGRFPELKGDLFIGSLKFRLLVRLEPGCPALLRDVAHG